MKLVFKDPAAEILLLIAQAKGNPSVECVSVSKPEMKALLANGKAKKVFPKYFAQRAARLEPILGQMERIRQQLSVEGLSEADRQKLFDVMDVLEEKEAVIKEFIPKQVIEDGYVIKTSLRQ